MKIDLTCPVELWHFKMPTAEDPVCMVQLYNLSEKTEKVGEMRDQVHDLAEQMEDLLEQVMQDVKTMRELLLD